MRLLSSSDQDVSKIIQQFDSSLLMKIQRPQRGERTLATSLPPHLSTATLFSFHLCSLLPPLQLGLLFLWLHCHAMALARWAQLSSRPPWPNGRLDFLWGGHYNLYMLGNALHGRSRSWAMTQAQTILSCPLVQLSRHSSFSTRKTTKVFPVWFSIRRKRRWWWCNLKRRKDLVRQRSSSSFG